MFSPLFLFASSVWRVRKSRDPVTRASSLVSRATEIPPFRLSLPDFGHELARARRYERPLAIVVLGVDDEQIPKLMGRPSNGNGNGNGSADSEKQSMAPVAQFVSLVLGSLLREVMRGSDLVTYSSPEDRYVILLTESNEARARRAVQRLDELFYRRTLAHVRAGIAEFPSDGLTLEDLLSRAQSAWQERPVRGLTAEPPAGKETSVGALTSVYSRIPLADKV